MLLSGAALLVAPKAAEGGEGGGVVVGDHRAARAPPRSGFDRTRPSPRRPIRRSRSPSTTRTRACEHDVVVASADPAKDPTAADSSSTASVITGVASVRLRGAAPARGQVLLLLPVPPDDDDRDAHDRRRARVPGAAAAGRRRSRRRSLAFDTDTSDVPGGHAHDAHVPERRRRACRTTSRSTPTTSASKALFRGDIVTGVATGDYHDPGAARRARISSTATSIRT